MPKKKFALFDKIFVDVVEYSATCIQVDEQ
jgi:hypothetical protein